MQLVIEISEGLKFVCEHAELWLDQPKVAQIMCQGMKKVLENAVVLSKEHGRLIDADEFNRNLQSAEYDTYNDYSNTFDWIETAPTIVEADKAESEDM